jgi:hypothetical protein
MTRHSRMPRIILGLVVPLALAAAAAGCAKNPATAPNAAPPGGDSADGQFGEASATPEATPTEVLTTPPDPEPSPTKVGPGVILTINPNLLLLLWPSPADCVSYDPTTAAITVQFAIAPATPTYHIKSGSTTVLSFKRMEDAQEGLKVVKAYKQHCWVGRGNSMPTPEAYTMDYWLSPVSSPTIASPDCFPHTASELAVKDNGNGTWTVRTNSELISSFDTKAQAQDAILVMKHYNRHCYLGRGYSGTDRQKYIYDWFATV